MKLISKEEKIFIAGHNGMVGKSIYKTFKGWKRSTKGIKNIDELPQEAKDYIFAIEDFVEAKISSISTSPERDDTILIENPFEI